MSGVARFAADDASLAPARKIIQFGRLLRDNDYMLDLCAVGDAVRLLDTPDLLSPAAVRGSLRAQFCRSRAELERFDELFDAYWLGRVSERRRVHRRLGNAAESVVDRNGAGQAGAAAGLARYFDWAGSEAGEDAANDGAGAISLGGASRGPGIARSETDLRHVRDPEEAALMLGLAERLGRRLRYRLSRRRHAARRGSEIDLRSTIRHSLATGGIPVSLRRRRRPHPPVSLLVFIDVSGSMDAYSLFFTRFLHALTHGFARVDGYLFHTRLVPVGSALGERDPAAAMNRMTRLGSGWSGGTDMGAALATFNRAHATRGAASRTIALIMTDGFDAGKPAQLDIELARLRARCHRLVWLNPLLGLSDYRTEARGARLLARHADRALPAHNLASLMALEEVLAHV